MEPPSTNTAINHNPSSPPDSSDSGNVDDDQLLVPEYVPPFPFDHDAKDGSDLRIHATFGSALPKLAFPVPSGDREVTKHTYVPPPTPGNTAKEFSLNDVLTDEERRGRADPRPQPVFLENQELEDEPHVGTFFQEFDRAAYEQQRASCPVTSYTPRRFLLPADFKILGEINAKEYPAQVRVDSFDDIEKKKDEATATAIKFVCVNTLPVPPPRPKMKNKRMTLFEPAEATKLRAKTDQEREKEREMAKEKELERERELEKEKERTREEEMRREKEEKEKQEKERLEKERQEKERLEKEKEKEKALQLQKQREIEKKEKEMEDARRKAEQEAKRKEEAERREAERKERERKKKEAEEEEEKRRKQKRAHAQSDKPIPATLRKPRMYGFDTTRKAWEEKLRANLADDDDIEEDEPDATIDAMMEEPPDGDESASPEDLSASGIATLPQEETLEERREEGDDDDPMVDSDEDEEEPQVEARHEQDDDDELDITVDTPLDKKQIAKLPKDISNHYKNLEVLILRGVGVQKLDDFKLPHLIYANLTSNAIASIKTVVTFVKRCPKLQSINLASNPVAVKTGCKEKVLVAGSSLRFFNGRGIKLEELLQAHTSEGSKKKIVDFLRWDRIFGLQNQVRRMVTWQPEAIREVKLRGCGLTAVHIGCLVNLKRADFARNKLTDISGMGLEKCGKLHRLHLSCNNILKRECLAVLRYVPSLFSLHLRGNHVGLKQLNNYRLFVIFHTRWLPGTNRTPGLQAIDGYPISINERVRAVFFYAQKYAPKNERQDPNHFRWQLNLISLFGHQRVQVPDQLAALTHVILPNVTLTYADVRKMPNLRILDLSGNNLIRIDSLEELHELKLLNLAGNPKLNLKDTLQQLSKCTKLEHVSFCFMKEGHELHPAMTKYRMAVTSALLKLNRHLDLLDKQWIAAAERIESYNNILKATKKKKPEIEELVERYRFQLMLFVRNIADPLAHKWHHDDLMVDKNFFTDPSQCPYDPKTIRKLRTMSSLDLQSRFCDFSAFDNLEELNLSHNKIADPTEMGLAAAASTLRVLDLSHNQIAIPHPKIAAFLDSLTALECVALHHNPCMRSDADRKAITRNMKSLRQVECVLRVMDREITMEERIEAWREGGGAGNDYELLRWNAVMSKRERELGVLAGDLIALDLNGAGFQRVDFSQYNKLEVLLLRRNRLTTILNSGILGLKSLRVLDLRDNLIAEQSEIITLVRACHNLVSLGVSGNRFNSDPEERRAPLTSSRTNLSLSASTSSAPAAPPPSTRQKRHRHRLLKKLPELHERHCALRVLDDIEIQAREIIEAWKSTVGRSGKECTQNFRFKVLLLRNLPQDGDMATVTTLDLSGCELDFADLSSFASLQRLNLACNNISSLQKTNIESLTRLQVLNLRENKFKDLDSLCSSIKSLASLHALEVVGNPVCPTDTTDDRSKLLAGMLHLLEATQLPLRVLNAKEITIAEMCAAISKASGADKAKTEEARLELCFQRLRVKISTETLCLSGFQYSSVKGLQALQNLTSLDLSSNKLRKMEKVVFRDLPNLTHLDLKHNELPGVRAIILGLLPCTSLVSLNVLRSTRNRDTERPRIYAKQVCKVLRWLQQVDNLQNPYGALSQGNQPKTRVLNIDITQIGDEPIPLPRHILDVVVP